jgi:hypothetical protein
VLKITAADLPGQRVLRLEGKLLSSWIPALVAACRAGGPLTGLELDLAGLSFADAEGLRALRRLADQGTHLTNCSPFIGELIQENRR